MPLDEAAPIVRLGDLVSDDPYRQAARSQDRRIQNRSPIGRWRLELSDTSSRAEPREVIEDVQLELGLACSEK